MKTVREWLFRSSQGLTTEQLLAVPHGSRNNILWNIGHVITDQCNMIYSPCGLASPLPADYSRYFDPGTSPQDWICPPEVSEVIETAIQLPDRVEADAGNGNFESFAPLALDDGIVLEDFDGALSHCNLHEAIHLGVIMTLRRLVK
jgi:hypothetical protein